MTGLRSQYDADRAEDLLIPTDYQTALNKNEVFCEMCGKTFYVDDFFFEQITRKIAETMENPFVCGECSITEEEISPRL